MREVLVKEFWEAYIKRTFQKPDIQRFLLTHERRGLCERNLGREIFGAELKFGTRMTRTKIQRLVEAGAALFAEGALGEVRLRHMSDAEKQVIKNKAGREKELQDWYQQENKEATSTATSLSMFTGKKPQ